MYRHMHCTLGNGSLEPLSTLLAAGNPPSMPPTASLYCCPLSLLVSCAHKHAIQVSYFALHSVTLPSEHAPR
jgi:hypothetical protein